MAKLLRIQPVSPNKSPAGNKSRENLQHDGADWTGVLNAWIDANVAADAVSIQNTRKFAWIVFDDRCEPSVTASSCNNPPNQYKPK